MILFYRSLFLLSLFSTSIFARESYEKLTPYMRFSFGRAESREVETGDSCNVHAITFVSSGGYNSTISKVLVTFKNNKKEIYNFNKEIINQEMAKGFNLTEYSQQKCISKIEVTATGSGACKGLTCGITWQVADLQPVLNIYKD
jgi:pantothenate kinase